MLKMIVTDLDGTLLAEHETITEANLKVLRKVMQEGTQLCIASGRNYENVQNLLKRYDLKASGIYGNGAEYIDEHGLLMKAHYFPKEHLKEVVEVFTREEIDMMIFATDNRFFTPGDPHDVNIRFTRRTADRFGRDFDELLHDPQACYHAKNLVYQSVDDLIVSDMELIKVEAFHTNLDKIKRAKKQLAQIDGIAYLSSFDDNVEVTDIKAQKGLILEDVITMLGYTKEEVIVLGDGMNDLTLFERFPYSYAPNNAVEEIRARAYKVVSGHTQQALADAIDDYQRQMNGSF